MGMHVCACLNVCVLYDTVDSACQCDLFLHVSVSHFTSPLDPVPPPYPPLQIAFFSVRNPSTPIPRQADAELRGTQVRIIQPGHFL